jgi:shikimate dehydrogenase
MGKMGGKEITGTTGVWVHLAHPSAHVRATSTFNRAFRERGLDVVAVSSDVAPADLPALVRGLRGWRNLAGIGVTMPHKEAIAALCDEVVGLGKLIKSVNAIRREPDGRLIGANTDGSGFLAGFRQAGYDPAGKRTLLVGIGGAGRAIAFSLAEAGVADLTLSNRTVAKAQAVAAEVMAAFPAASVEVGPPDPNGYDLVINATPLGMRDGDPLPLNASKLTAKTVVAEIIIVPERTRLLIEAERRGCRIHFGLPMLTCQIDEVITFLQLDGFRVRGDFG